MLSVISPVSGRPLRPDGPYLLSDAERHERWPVIDRIAYLRVGREALCRAVLEHIDQGRIDSARALLLQDQDDWAPLPPPDADAIARLADPALSLRQAMAVLNFGPVVDYFAHRWSTPTFLSGLALLDRHRAGQPPRTAVVLELACGIGQLLRELALRGTATVGIDVVFAKLWLARRYVLPPDSGRSQLICADACAPLPLAPAAANRAVTALCHDAFYFLADKPAAAAELKRVAGRHGQVLIGHAHNSNADQGGVGGTPLTPAGYAELFPGARLYDDSELAEALLAARPATPRTATALQNCEAVALAWTRQQTPSSDPAGAAVPDLSLPSAGARLRLNPLLTADAQGRLSPRWPSDRWAAEYRAVDYLCGERMPSAVTLERASDGDINDPEVARLARRRILLDLPAAW